MLTTTTTTTTRTTNPLATYVDQIADTALNGATHALRLAVFADDRGDEGKRDSLLRAALRLTRLGMTADEVLDDDEPAEEHTACEPAEATADAA